ncbi:WD40 repeat domain-containing serine/threonine protein kinase [Streptosporangium sp. NPDC000396]|uniref:WD40 repeat domain-containing serine/threonine protein kinase n=1 Tax=Streptosporangium sp. NPDC000396 TaxID=3366185 RepID=UPI003695F32D
MPEPLEPGDALQVGGYRLVGRLGGGGQGVVYLGSAQDGRPVAVKVLHARMAADPRARDRFLAEIEAAKQVAGFATASVLAADVDGAHPYVVSEYIPGDSLQQRVERDGPLAPGELHRLAVNTMTALAAIHRAEIVHRDLKPSNVLLGSDGARVIDFGIAKVLNGTSVTVSEVIGTVAYMSPEQVSARRLTAATDLFSWAGMMIFAATGRSPFGEGDVGAVLYRILHHEPELSALPDSLRGVLAACLNRDPSARPRADDVLLTLLGEGRPTLPISPRPRRRRLLWATLAVALALVLSFAVAVWPRTERAPGSKAPMGTQIRGPYEVHSRDVQKIIWATLNGRPVVVTSRENDRITVSDVRTGARVSASKLAFGTDYAALTVLTLSKRPAAVGVRKRFDQDELAAVDLETGERIGKPYSFPGASFTSLLTADEVVVAGYADGIITWNPVTGEVVRTRLHEDLTPLAVGEVDGDTVIVMGGARKVRLWNLTRRHWAAAAVATPVERPWSAAVSGGRFVLGGMHTDLYVGDLRTGRRVRTGPATKVQTVTDVQMINLPGGPAIVYAGVGLSAVLDLSTGRELTQIPAAAGFTTSMTAGMLDGRPVVVSGGANGLRLRDAQSGGPAGAGVISLYGGAVRLARCDTVNGRTVVVSAGTEDHSVRVTDLDSGAAVGEPFLGHSHGFDDDEVLALATGRIDGRPVVISAGQDGVRRSDAVTGAGLGEALPNTEAATAVTLTERSGRPAIVSVTPRNLVVSDPVTGDTIERTDLAFDDAVESDGTLLTAAGGVLYVNGSTRLDGDHDGETLESMIVGRGLAATGTRDGTIRVWNLATGRRTLSLPKAHHGWVTALALGELRGHPVLLSGGENGEVRLWDLAAGKPLGTPFTGHTAQVTTVAFCTLGQVPIAISAGDTTIRGWSLGEGTD